MREDEIGEEGIDRLMNSVIEAVTTTVRAAVWGGFGFIVSTTATIACMIKLVDRR
jgi:hypothetical protein